MKKLTLLLFICINAIQGQTNDSIVITGHIKNNTKFAKVIIKKFGIGSFDIAAVPIKEGKFKIAAPFDIETGVYRLQYSQSSLKEFVDVIIDGKEKNIAFEIDINKPEKLPVFSQSDENKKWYTYLQNQQNQFYKIELLSQFINQYPVNKDLIYIQTTAAFNKEKAVYKTNFNSFINKNKNLWVTEMVKNRPAIFSNPTDLIKIQDFDKRNSIFKSVNTSNPKLINTPLYTEHILNYLKYYMNPEMGFSEEDQEIGFKKSVDTIMQKFGANPETKKFALKYLQLGFKEIGNEKVLQYIDQKYKETIEQCQNDAEKIEFDKRMKGYDAMKQGTPAPNVFFDDKTGKIISLTDLPKQKTIIAFWASWCPNCEEQMPILQEYIKNNPHINAVAVSLDDDQTAYEQAIKKYPNLYHTCDFKKWKGKTVNDYYIYGSPTFILLDNENKIIGKFATWENVGKYLKENK